MRIYHSFAPIYDNNSKVLILGSMPSIVSREKNFYYANKQNRFWKIISLLFNTTLDTNEERKQFLLDNNIALWDVIKSCDITGSSDSSIKNIEYNDIATLINKTNIKYVFCTGKKAFQLFSKYNKQNIEVFYLPSPSSANAKISLENLTQEYSIILKYLGKY